MGFAYEIKTHSMNAMLKPYKMSKRNLEKGIKWYIKKRIKQNKVMETYIIQHHQSMYYKF